MEDLTRRRAAQEGELSRRLADCRARVRRLGPEAIVEEEAKNEHDIFGEGSLLLLR